MFIWKVPTDAYDSDILYKNVGIQTVLLKSSLKHHTGAVREFLSQFGKSIHSKIAFLSGVKASHW